MRVIMLQSQIVQSHVGLWDNTDYRSVEGVDDSRSLGPPLPIATRYLSILLVCLMVAHTAITSPIISKATAVNTITIMPNSLSIKIPAVSTTFRVTPVASVVVDFVERLFGNVVGEVTFGVEIDWLVVCVTLTVLDDVDDGVLAVV